MNATIKQRRRNYVPTSACCSVAAAAADAKEWATSCKLATLAK